MYTFYADDSNLRLSPHSPVSDTLLFGGIIIPKTEEKKIERIMNNLITPYGSPCYPVKWNFRDLKAKYQKEYSLDVYTRMMAQSHHWRRTILERSLETDYTIVIAGIHSYSSDKAKIASSVPAFTRYAFTNALQRVALEVKDLKVNHMEVVLDWPSGNNHQPFTDEFREAYHRGRSVDGHGYRSGPLKHLNFSSTPHFSHSTDSYLLQFTDLVVGAVKDCINATLNNKADSLGSECTRMLVPKFRGYPDAILSRGLKLRPCGINEAVKLKNALFPFNRAA